MKCTPSPTADIKMEAMPGGGGGVRVKVQSRWRNEGAEGKKSKV